jgi:hypothetical protein
MPLTARRGKVAILGASRQWLNDFLDRTMPLKRPQNAKPANPANILHASSTPVPRQSHDQRDLRTEIDRGNCTA